MTQTTDLRPQLTRGLTGEWDDNERAIPKIPGPRRPQDIRPKAVSR